MRVESVSYRYSRNEVLALMSLAGTDRIPGLSLGKYERGDITQGLQSLEDEGIALHAGDRWHLERTTRYMFKAASSVKRLLKAGDGAQELLLYRLDGMVLLIKAGPEGSCEFTPLRKMSDSWQKWRDAVSSIHGTSVQLVLSDHEKILSLCRLSREEAAAIDGKTLDRAMNAWEPASKEDNPWKASL